MKARMKAVIEPKSETDGAKRQTQGSSPPDPSVIRFGCPPATSPEPVGESGGPAAASPGPHGEGGGPQGVSSEQQSSNSSCLGAMSDEFRGSCKKDRIPH